MNATKKRMLARRKKVRELYAQDLQVSVIAEHLEVSQPTIYKDLLALGLREKDKYSPAHTKAISRGIKRRNARNVAELQSKRSCCVCGKPAMKKRYRKNYYCGECLQTAGDHDPKSEEKQRAAAGGRFASSGVMDGA